MVPLTIIVVILAIIFVVSAVTLEPNLETPRGQLLDVAACEKDMLQRKLIQTGRASQSTDNGKVSEPPAPRKIFTYWDYPQGIDPFVELNIRSWLLHAPPGTEVVRINDTNFRDFVPDAPDEVFKLPYPAAKSDAARAAVLYHHGGLYMDTDFVVMKDLSGVFAKLDEGWDVVAYSDKGGEPSGACQQHYTSNFMAGRKGNVVSGTWWENIKVKLTRLCGEGDYGADKVCCRAAFMEDPESCNVPWGYLEWLKVPENDPDVYFVGSNSTRDSPEELKLLEIVRRTNQPAKALPEDARIFCFQGNESFAPHLNGEVWWQKWDFATRATSTVEGDGDGYINYRFQCKDENGGLVCEKGQWGEGQRVIPNVWGRIAYHLFFQTTKFHADTTEDVLNSDWLLAELYHRSLGKVA